MQAFTNRIRSVINSKSYKLMQTYFDIILKKRYLINFIMSL